MCRWKGLQTEDQHVPSTTWEEHRELHKPKEGGMAGGQRARGRAGRKEKVGALAEDFGLFSMAWRSH